MNKNRIKGITVRRHLDTSTISKAKGGCRWSLCVSLRGEKKYYPIEPAIHMDPKFWVAQSDPTTGNVIREKTIVHAKGNVGSRHMEQMIAEKETAMRGLVEKLMVSGSVTHAMVWAKWTHASTGTLLEWCGKYMDSQVNAWGGGKSGRTYSLYSGIIKHLGRFDPRATIERVDAGWISTLHHWLLTTPPNSRMPGGKGLSVSYAGTSVNFVGAVLSMAVDAGVIGSNPLDVYRRSKSRPTLACEAAPAIPLTEQEVERLQTAWETAELDTPKLRKHHEMLQQALICIYTGFRYSDLCQLQEGGRYTLSDTHLSLVMAKTGKPIRVAVTARLASALPPRPGNGLLIGAVPDGRVQSRKLREMLAKLGITTKMDWHDLRKTFVTILYDRTGDLKAVSSAVGHSKVSMTEAHYLKESSSHVDKVVGALDGLGAKKVTATMGEVLDQIAAMVAANPGLKLPPKLAALVSDHCGIVVNNPPVMKVV